MSFSHDTRVVIYPSYLNSKKTLAEGRKLPISKGCENPTAPEILECCIRGLKLAAELEDKAYSRDYMLRGRVRVQLKKPDGSFANPEVKTRHALYTRVADLVTRIPNRAKRGGQQAIAGAAGPSSSAAASAAPAVTSAAAAAAAGREKAKAKKKGKR